LASDETEPMENCGLVKLTFKNVKVKGNSETPEKLKETPVYVNIKCYPFNEYVKIAYTEDLLAPERHVYL
jgi:hypothetical protein